MDLFSSLISSAHTEDSQRVCPVAALLLPVNLKTHALTHFFVLCGMSLEVVITLASRVSISQLNKSVLTC